MNKEELKSDRYKEEAKRTNVQSIKERPEWWVEISI
jgi:hypothetical protein